MSIAFSNFDGAGNCQLGNHRSLQKSDSPCPWLLWPWIRLSLVSPGQPALKSGWRSSQGGPLSEPSAERTDEVQLDNSLTLWSPFFGVCSLGWSPLTGDGLHAVGAFMHRVLMFYQPVEFEFFFLRVFYDFYRNDQLFPDTFNQLIAVWSRGS